MTHSLYTDKEIFLRELISNASDALEKARYLQANNKELVDGSAAFEIRIDVDEERRTLTVTDSGIGMTEEELVSHLGTIARSGSKAFIQQLQDGQKAGGAASPAQPELGNIIGKFGVGFYSTFMVGDSVEVFTQSATDADGGSRYWSSDGSGQYEVSTIERQPRGTKVVVHLKDSCAEYSKKQAVESIIRRYSAFVGFPIILNGERLNTIGALWTQSKDSVTEQQHTDFYRYFGNAYDTPLFRLHFSVDAPIALHALFYFPSRHMERYGMGRLEPGVSLYSRKVLIQAKSKLVLPEWLRWVKGVVDSEDIPLNISRESMQDSRLLKRINDILTRRVIKFLDEQSRADKAKYEEFWLEYGNFIKEGVCTDFDHRKDIAKLLRFDSSQGGGAGDGDKSLVSLDDYVSRLGPAQQSIYYLSAPSRSYALSSPYYESFRERGQEVLFCYAAIDEFVMRNLEEYNGRKIVSVDSDAGEEGARKEADKKAEGTKAAGDQAAEERLLEFISKTLGDKVSEVKASSRHTSSPALIINSESASMRRMLRYVEQSDAPAPLSKQRLEVNTRHPIMQRLAHSLTAAAGAGGQQEEAVRRLVVEQVFDNACVVADLMDNPRAMVGRLNELLLQLLEREQPAAAATAAAAAPAAAGGAEAGAETEAVVVEEHNGKTGEKQTAASA